MNGTIAEKDIISDLSESLLCVDTCCLIHATKQISLIGKFLFDLRDSGCVIFTIPIVNLEFLRNVDTIKAFADRKKFLNELTKGVTYPIEKYLDAIPEYPLVMGKIKCNPDLADYLQIASLVKHPETYLLTENHQHMPLSILDRESIIAFDNNNGIKVFGLYKLNKEKYDNTVKTIK